MQEAQRTAAGGNPLGSEKVAKLLVKFAVPSIVSLLVNALYNIVDQIFIGQGVGMLGNAATNVAFPLTTISTAVALLIGVGTASNFNLSMGRGDKQKAARLVGTGVSLLVVCGVALCAIVLVFLRPLMLAFGATEAVLPYALTYTGITSLGLPFMILSSGCSNLIRADGKPTYSMICLLAGAVFNTIFDPIFIFVFKMGIAGAALATVLGQILSCALAFSHLFRFKTVQLKLAYFRPKAHLAKQIASLGMASCFNQLAMTVVQIALNNTLTRFGAQSVYGSDIPLAVVGIISKVNMVYMSLVIGTAHGCQPIFGFNYGAKNYARVKQTYKLAAIFCSLVSIVAFICFQLFPRNIISLFGSAAEAGADKMELYFQFGEKYFRTYMLMAFLNGLQPLTSNFFTSIGKATRGIFMSLTRQVIFLLPLILLLPRVFGIEGVLFAGPVADSAAAILAVCLVYNEMKKMGRQPLPAPQTKAGG